MTNVRTWFQQRFTGKGAESASTSPAVASAFTDTYQGSTSGAGAVGASAKGAAVDNYAHLQRLQERDAAKREQHKLYMREYRRRHRPEQQPMPQQPPRTEGPSADFVRPQQQPALRTIPVLIDGKVIDTGAEQVVELVDLLYEVSMLMCQQALQNGSMRLSPQQRSEIESADRLKAIWLIADVAPAPTGA
jgi:hypothetical protein